MHPHIASFNLNLGTQTPQALEVQVDGARANHAAAGQRHHGLLQACQERTQDADRSPHLADQFVITAAGDVCGSDGQGAAVLSHLGSEGLEDLKHETNVAQVGHPTDDAGFGGEQRCRKNGQHSVLRAADGHFSV